MESKSRIMLGDVEIELSDLCNLLNAKDKKIDNLKNKLDKHRCSLVACMTGVDGPASAHEIQGVDILRDELKVQRNKK
jgi:hypothetical protein|tara:strand:+ start:168 stop:401 length:234 start_codon:yes stop_codon:yes gene_type:complete